MTLKVILEKGADGYIIAECPQIPGCMSQGKTKEEALANIKDAVQACLKERLTAFERQYRMTSEDFAVKFNAGELGDDADWFEWQYLFEVLDEIGAMIELKESQP